MSLKPSAVFPFLFVLFFSLLLILLGYAYPIIPPGSDPPHHALLTHYILEQKTLAIHWSDGTSVNYPLFFHVLAGAVTIGGIPLYRAGFILSLGLLLGNVILFFLVVRRFSSDAAYFGLFLLCLSPALLTYELVGLYPNILGMFLYLLMLLLLLRNGFTLRISLACGVITGMLVLTNGIAAVTGIIIVISYITALYFQHSPPRTRYLLTFAATAVLISLPWSLTVFPRLLAGHHLLYAPGWTTYSESLARRLFKDFGILPLLAVGSILTVKKMKKNTQFLFLIASIWLFLLLILSLSVWGHRFLLEAVIPLCVVSALFLEEIKQKKYFIIIFLLCVSIQPAVFSNRYVPALTFDPRLEQENLHTLGWIQDNTLEDASFYHAILLYPVYVTVISQREVINVSVKSAAEERIYPFYVDLETLACPQVLKALQERGVSYVYLANREALTYSEDESFSPFAYLEENRVFMDVYAGGRTRIYLIIFAETENFSMTCV